MREAEVSVGAKTERWETIGEVQELFGETGGRMHVGVEIRMGVAKFWNVHSLWRHFKTPQGPDSF